MTSKHFEAIAKVLRDHRPSTIDADWYKLIDAMADTCAEANPRFDRSRFITACRGYKI
jgi:hypothetical protein